MHRSWLSDIVIDCHDLEAGVRFWTGALGAEVESRDEPYVSLSRVPGGIGLGLQHVPEPKTAKSRVHLDLTTDDLEAEVSRLEALGARRQQLINGWWVMEDPCGNEFCVLPHGGEELPEDARSWGA